MHPTEYIIPLIHERHRDGFNPDFIPKLHPTVEPEEEIPRRDPFYSNAGMLLYLGYLKNFPTFNNGTLKIKCSVYLNTEPVTDDLNTSCIWVSDIVQHVGALKQTPENQYKIQELVTNEILQDQDTVLPIKQTKVWYKDFYNMLWDTDGPKVSFSFIFEFS